MIAKSYIKYLAFSIYFRVRLCALTTLTGA